MAAPQPAAHPPHTHRILADGAEYTVSAVEPGITTLAIRDADGDDAAVSLDRAGARRLVDDLELAAGIRPTPPTIGRAAALAGSIRIIFEQLRELDKTEPAEVEALVASLVSHVRSWRHVALLAGGAP